MRTPDPPAVACVPGAPDPPNSTLTQRRLWLCAVACGNDVDQLQHAVAAAGCTLTRGILETSAEAGALTCCVWLTDPARELPPPVPWQLLLSLAAVGGREEVCVWCIQQCGTPWTPYILADAARGGHVELLECLLARYLESAASDSSEQARLWRLHGEGVFAPADPFAWEGPLAAALAAPTADWAEKVAWLMEQCEGFMPPPLAFVRAARLPHAVERFDWLLARGVQPTAEGVHPLRVAIEQGDESAVRWLLDHGCRTGPYDASAVQIAAERGHVAVLKALATAGCLGPAACAASSAPGESASPATALGEATVSASASPQEDGTAAGGGADTVHALVGPELALAAARGGSLEVLTWLVQAFGKEALGGLTPELFCAAAASGSVEVMAWLAEHMGRTWRDERAWFAAAASGCEAALGWLADRGCPRPADGRPYVEAAHQGDLRTLAVLRHRIGLPFGDGDRANLVPNPGPNLVPNPGPNPGPVPSSTPASTREGGHEACGDGGRDACGATFAAAVCEESEPLGQGPAWRGAGAGSGWEREQSAPPAALRWLLDAGCPVDWTRAEAAARMMYRAADKQRVVEWLEKERRERVEAGKRAQGGGGGG
ncbi:hypothetical protein HYH03_009588 [Edaphochlamys debaryana]|uniref:Ankyrin repeat domain-containing protein n=1 Tax=Edaphochlamys debaryana TaxID=47281 RepID=A0A835Y6V9_9CHLO|nr:hypothetical protein HYH03_009588 [Edaphochlamys debaryana]|eukprot:KAG2492094.1 hypothetical protein HYH03_009588 [Edaphochlamys debaryana]